MEKDENIDVIGDDSSQTRHSIPIKVARSMAKHPYKWCFGTFLLCIFLSFAVGVMRDNIDFSIDSRGWRSRSTLIAKREMQSHILARNLDRLFEDYNGTAWVDIETNVVRGYERLGLRAETAEDEESDRRLYSNYHGRHLFVDGCNPTKYYSTMFSKDNLYAVYKTEETLEESTKSILDADVLFDEVCEAETFTHQKLEENRACGGCDNVSQCLPPHSLLLVLRLQLGALDSSCSELKELYTDEVKESFTTSLVNCAQEIHQNYDSSLQTYDKTKCPIGFEANLIDKNFGKNGNTNLRYTSSYFITYQANEEALYDVRPYGETNEAIVSVVYETFRQSQSDIYALSLVMPDMFLAMGSLLITFAAIATHTKSMWLTVLGVLQIILSVPLSVFVYLFIGRIKFFPFLNLIGVFVAAALGADDVFVAVDKWKNARIADPTASTEKIASIALPNAASAMLLTTSTTAVAFFATMITPVLPIFCFALFCGLLIMFNYVLNIFLVFPAICLYDIWLMNGSRNRCVHFGCCGQQVSKIDDVNKGKGSLIHAILSVYYNLLHKVRYGALVACLVVTGMCIRIALTMKLPDSADVRVLPENSPFEKHNTWKQELQSFELYYSGGSFGEVTWGIIAADTGKKIDPDSLSTLVLDESFEASSTETQQYLLSFCERLFDNDLGLALPLSPEIQCPMNEFDAWLRNESALPNPSTAYISNCNGASSVPVPEEDFDSCIITWSELHEKKGILEKLGKVVIIRLAFFNDISWDAPFTEMSKFWKRFEVFMQDERAAAPPTANKMFQTAGAYWWYDTNASLLQTAISACIIAVVFSTIIVFISSRSLALTVFATLSITYVLAATTSSLVGFGWSLGFLESVCFSILVGISCDFVIHFGHAYKHQQGNVSRFDRTKYAVIHMGPSILAAAFTTFAAAIVMLFCQILFFTKFALILLMTVLHATLASFVFYIALSDSVGPSEPTKFVDGIFTKCSCNTNEKENKEIHFVSSDDVDEKPIYDLGKTNQS